MKSSKKLILFPMPGNEIFGAKAAMNIGAEIGKCEISRFPDEESYVRILSDVKGKSAVIVCTLHKPNEHFLPLYFVCKTLRQNGVKDICLAAPYLAYMRQDRIFRPGEGVTSEFFGEIISSFVDSIITIDPHLHRHKSLGEIYGITNFVVHAADHISEWIKKNVRNPVIVGPDEESGQWVKDVAVKANAPFTVLEKTREGSRSVKVSVPHLDNYSDHTPVLVDDIISTAHTMIETVKRLKGAVMNSPVCIGVHPIFAENAYSELLDAGAKRIVTCNTIPHISNDIDVSNLFTEFLMR